MPTGRPCTICQHPKRNAIDDALVDPHLQLPVIAARYRVSRLALKRHQAAHLPVAAREIGAAAFAEAEGVRGSGLLAKATELRERCMDLLAKAEASADIRAANGSLREARECLKLEAQLLGELGSETTVTNNIVISNPQFLIVQAKIMGALAPFPEARAAVGLALQAIQ